ncbi:MAG: L,D-transpeptidase [Pseudomonadota bacterium]
MQTSDPDRQLIISLSVQRLILQQKHQVRYQFPVSTARHGAGQQAESGCTPTGRHVIHRKIGAGCPVNTVFTGRIRQAERYSAALAARHPERDWILTRILWLAGCEPGHNQGGTQDTLARYIYIHGTPDTEPMGIPKSHGCIRMRNRDIITLFDQVDEGTPVSVIA